ncbi:MAG: hypothetical protein ACOCTT_02445 [archaeon]
MADEIEYKIVNLVASADLKKELDLYGIAMEVDNVEYEPEQFPGAILKLKDIGTTLLLFKTGRIICTGGEEEKDVKNSMKKVSELIKDYTRE